jgi:hypothetical protein
MVTRSRVARRLFAVRVLSILFFYTVLGSTVVAAPPSPPVPPAAERTPGVIVDVRTNVDATAAVGSVPRYGKFEVAFQVAGTTATNPYLPYDANTPPGVAPGTGISVDAFFLPPGEADWGQARTTPCFYYQPVEEVGSGEEAALLPVGPAGWRCRFAPDTVGEWRYKIRVVDGRGTSEGEEATFGCVPSQSKGYVGTSATDGRFFEFSDGTPFVTPLVNLEQGSPFSDLAAVRRNVPRLGEGGVRFVRWFPTGEGANYAIAPYGDTMRINWGFGAGGITASDVDAAAGKQFSFSPYYYSAQRIPVYPGAHYRLSLRAKVTGERVLRPQLGTLSGGSLDICSATSTYHQASGGTCDVRTEGWQDYALTVTVPASGVTSLGVALRGLYVSGDAPAPYNVAQAGSIAIHSIVLQRDETGSGGWGPNLLTRSDPDTHEVVDQRAAALLDEVLRLSEQYGVYHKLTLFHKNDAVLNRIQPDGSIGPWGECGWGTCPTYFYSDDAQAARWYELAYTRYFVARWSYSTALHSVELANENMINDGSDGNVYDASFAIAAQVKALAAREVLTSNSFWGWWVAGFWTDPARGELMDYADQHWYANEEGSGCQADGSCMLISNVWDDSAAYVRECWRQFVAYSETYGYDKPIVRGEGGTTVAGTEPQHPLIAEDPEGTYYHKKLWAHVGTLGYTCDGDWYPRLFVAEKVGGFPNQELDLYTMFAAYERFVAGEALSSGAWAPLGTDLAGSEAIALGEPSSSVRAWGVQAGPFGRTLLWIDNATHTWSSVVDGAPRVPASATLTIPGFVPGAGYAVQWWDPYAGPGTDPIVRTEPKEARADGTIVLSVQGLERDVALKIVRADLEHVYLPLTLRLAP